MKHVPFLSVVAAAALLLPQVSHAQHLFWKLQADSQPLKNVTMLYGEITVLATGPCIYYCGVNWHPGEAGGGYCGIQDNGNDRRCTIFSMWDTSPTLHPQVIQQDPRVEAKRFGGEGTGAHSHIDYRWEIGKTFHYCVTKQPDKSGQNTLTTYYFYDDTQQKWVLESVISSPTDNHDSLRYFGGGMNAFLEQYVHQEVEKPKLCIYRLWAGTTPENLKFLRTAVGDVDRDANKKGEQIAAHWGVMQDGFYLGVGAPDALQKIIAAQPKSSGDVLSAKANQALPPILDRPLSAKTIAALKALPQPDDVRK